MLSSREARAADHLAEESARLAREEYIKPLIMLAVGVALVLVASFFELSESGVVGMLGTIVGFAVALIISVIVAFVGLAIASAMIGLDAGPITLVFTRLAAIYSVLLPVSMLMPLGGLLWGIAMLLILAGLVAMMFDFEMFEAAITVLLIMLINVIVNLLLMAVFHELAES